MGDLQYCHHRVALDDKSVQLGLPEVTLGLLPGGGGVVRMVRMLGLEKPCRICSKVNPGLPRPCKQA